MAAGGLEVRDDHALIKIQPGSAAALGAAFEVVGVEAGEDEELVGALDVQEEALVAAGAINGGEIIVAVEALDLALGLMATLDRAAAEVCADDGDVISDGDLGDADAFEGVADDEEEEKLGGEQGAAIANDEVIEEFGVVKNEGHGLGVFAEFGEALASLVGEGEGLEDEVPIRLSEAEPTAGTREV